MKKNIFLALIFVLLIACQSQNESQENKQVNTDAVEQSNTHPKGQASVEDDVSKKNILQVAISSKDHTTLVAAVQAAEIEHVLVNAGPLTVFAPVNAAFDALPEGTIENLLKPENKGQLATILTHHASPGSFDIEALKKEAGKNRKVYTASGIYLDIEVNGDEVQVGGAKILGTIQTSNGIINVVDKVILPN